MAVLARGLTGADCGLIMGEAASIRPAATSTGGTSIVVKAARGPDMRVFISHSSRDKPAVEALAIALRERGIEAWLDKWMIGPGDDIVARINDGLEQADAGVIVFSAHSRESRWVEAEVSYLTYARIQESKVLIPVCVGQDAYVPPLLRPLARRGIEEVDAIADALLHRRAGPPPVASGADGRCERVLVSLRRDGASGVRVRVLAGRRGIRQRGPSGLAPRRGRRARRVPGRLPRRGQAQADEASRAAIEAEMAGLGRALRDFCLPGGSGEAIASLAAGCAVGTVVEVCFEADDPELLGLPFEALRLPGRPPARHAARRGHAATAGGDRRRPPQPPLAGPIKVLIAVGAPTRATPARPCSTTSASCRTSSTRWRRPSGMRTSRCGSSRSAIPGSSPRRSSATPTTCCTSPATAARGSSSSRTRTARPSPPRRTDLIEPIRRHGRPLPLVFLNACHGGVQKEQTASFSESLLRAGVPCVVAMQTSVSDHYATELARAFYEHLARREPPLVSRALAEARKEIEQARLQALRHHAPAAETQPEYATAALVRGRRRGAAGGLLPGQGAAPRPAGVPRRRPGAAAPHRRPGRVGGGSCARPCGACATATRRRTAGVVLTGLGGVGKSAVAGRAMQRLTEDGWLVAAHAGRFDLRAIAAEPGRGAPRIRTRRAAAAGRLAAGGGPRRPGTLPSPRASSLAEDPVVLVLDDFEQNLAVGGGAFLDPDVGLFFGLLARSASRGRLLLTCRYPVPGMEAELHEVPIGPLSPAEARKLVQRLPGLKERAPAEVAQVLRVIGGHPRILEFLDALLRGGAGRLPHVSGKLREVANAAGIDLEAAAAASLDDRLQQAVLLGMRDVLLDELVDLARAAGAADLLFQAAVSTLPTSPAGLAHMLADGPADADAAGAGRALARLADLSLVYRFPERRLGLGPSLDRPGPRRAR